ncbi:hypothetical protein GQ56_0121590 [Burkholderia paludis]|uniref:TetR family transcriptional regulator n=1 Tax=Burkholderia paludis TaxID=1506587 RepID=A0A6J5DD48_9BURK|nr:MULTISPECIES: TetR/AcrR family transcriptional regulator [Burkholderia]KFG95222.1 hypothetical protein GQ56_0121590 [Burkholderia paludis]CAB3751364.1 hypothetical protein LMG30113_01455 [Burkholderia paludis]VWB07194.1 TetR family transcriptional regulator [Burkholderia paludis]
MSKAVANDGKGPGRKSAAKPEIEKRERILLTAERLFAADGYHGVSMRDIAKEADVGLPLIVYHFETKLGLYRSIFEYRRSLFDERRILLEKIADFEGPDALLKIATAFVLPIVKSYATPDGSNYAMLVVREASDPQEEARGIIEAYYDPVARAFMAAVKRALPGVTDEYLHWSYHFAVGALVMSVFDRRIERLSGGKFRNVDVTRKAKMLAAFIADGMQGGARRFKRR